MVIDFRKALNALSDVVQNRPIPLREFDQIYMKIGDLVIQAEFIARKMKNLDVIFIGDGDAIGLSIVHLKKKKIFTDSPSHILVLDFDERIVNSINKFAYNNKLSKKINAILYNVCDPLPSSYRHSRDGFYTNPPWGASNKGQSVTAFIQRGMEAIKPKGLGAIVIADDEELDWTNQVLFNTQDMVIKSGFIVSEMIPGLHKYHLDDDPDLTSCCILVRNVSCKKQIVSKPLSSEVLNNFYGFNTPLKVKYVKDLSGLNSGKAPDGSYKLIPLEDKK